MWTEATGPELSKQAEALDFFDASAWLGRTPQFPLMQNGTAQLLEGIQRDSFVNGALVSYWAGTDEASSANQDRLLREIDGHDGWYATVVLSPLYPQDQHSPASDDWVWHERIRAARVYPNSFKYPLVDWCAGTLCEALIERRMPLFVFHTETDWRDLYNLAGAFPELNIVVESQPKKILYHLRALLPLMKACPNIHLETSNLCNQGIVEYVVNTLGAERLIFGSFSPACDPLVPAGMVLQAEISEDAKRLIAGGNIRRMIEEVRL